MCVSPILDYACGAWSTTGVNIHKLDSIQHQAIRFYSGLPKNAPILGLIGDMGLILGAVRRDVEVLRLYTQIMKMPAD